MKKLTEFETGIMERVKRDGELRWNVTTKLEEQTAERLVKKGLLNVDGYKGSRKWTIKESPSA